MTLFSPAELRLLALGDQIDARGARLVGQGHAGGRQATGACGSLSWRQAKGLHDDGATLAEMAKAAGLTVNGVRSWRQRNGLTKKRGAA